MLNTFVVFGFSHCLALIVIFVIMILMITYCLVRHTHPSIQTIGQGILFSIIVYEMMYPFYAHFYLNLSIVESLPLHLCDFSRLLLAGFLYFESLIMIELSFFWGGVGGIVALLTPDVQRNFPSIEFMMFFASHALILLAIGYCCIKKRFIPTHSSVIKASVFGILASICIYQLNGVLGVRANYWYLMKIPSTIASMYGFMPAKPWHLLVYYLIAVSAFYSIYLCTRVVHSTILLPSQRDRL